MSKNTLCLLLISLNIFGQNLPKNGLWRAEIPTVIGQLPFHILIETQKGKTLAYAVNGNEKLVFDSLYVKGDSVKLTMDLFDAEIIAKVNGDKMDGVFRKKMGNLSVREGHFTADYNLNFRFKNAENPNKLKVNGKYKTVFRDNSGSYDAIGSFEQKNTDITGTFLTTTGDYRFLQGNIVNDSLMLSCFDGTHIYLFKAKIAGDSLVGGMFCSSFRNIETWQAVQNEKATLPDANSLTFLKPGYKSIDFSFKDMNGKPISINDVRFKNKVTVVQILGTWCPNCMDETRFLADFYKKHKNIEIVGLAFEKSIDPSFANPKIEKLIQRFNVKYPILLAGKNDKNDVNIKLPMLSKVLSFPTTIFIDKKGLVRKIHTGFSGPGTGEYYIKFVDDFSRFIEKLEKE